MELRCHPTDKWLHAEQGQFLARPPLHQQWNVVTQRAVIEAGVLGPNHRLDDVASQIRMPPMKLFHELADPYLPTEYRHRDKICTTFTVSSTAEIDVDDGQPRAPQPSL